MKTQTFEIKPQPLLWKVGIASASLIALYFLQAQELFLLGAAVLLAGPPVSALAGWHLARRLEFTAQWPDTAHARTARNLRVVLWNHGFLPSPPCTIVAQIRGACDPVKRSVGLLGSDERLEVDVELTMARRGVFSSGQLEVCCSVLGCFLVRRRWNETLSLIVHPHVCVLTEKPMGPGSPYNTLGTGNLPVGGHDIEFLGVREYVVGDSPRLIHWRTTARRGKLFVKEFARSSRADMSLFVDLGARGPWTDDLAEDVVTAAASIVHMLEVHRVRYQMLTSASELTHVRFGSGTAQYLHAMSVLTRAVHGEHREAAESLRTIAPLVPKPNGLIVFSAFPGRELLDLLEGLSAQGAAVTLLTPRLPKTAPATAGQKQTFEPVGEGGRKLRFPVVRHGADDLDLVLERLT